MSIPNKYALPVTYCVAAAGVGVFYLFDLPLPWLLGPLFGCLVAALAGLPLAAWKPLGNTMRTIFGLAIGLSVTPALFGQLPVLAGSIALVPLFILLIGLVGVPYFRWLGFDQPTAYYGAMPGGLQDMLVFGEEAGGDVRAMSLMQATRVMVIVSVLPIIMTLGMGQTLDQPIGAPVATLPAFELGLMVVASLLGWRVFAMFGILGASILGPMVFAAALSLSGAVTHRPPTEAILTAQFFLGMAVGVKYVGLTLRELRSVVLASVGYCLILAVISFIFAEIVLQLGFLPSVEAILSFAPGGQAEMAILALASGAEVAVVVTHHIIRILVVIIGAPIVSKLLR